MNNVYIGLLAFVSSFLGCFQVINLTQDRRVLLVLGSVCIGTCQLTVYRMAPHVDGVLGTLCYVIGGVLGAQITMFIKRRNR